MCAQRQAPFPFERVVTLLDILRAYAEAYVKGATALTALNMQIFYKDQQEPDYDVRNDSQLLTRLKTHLSDLLEHCQPHLPMTAIAVLRLRATINNAELMSTWQRADTTLQTMATEVMTRLEDELALNVFFRLTEARRIYFEAPTDGWKEVIARFPDTVSNIEEMSKSFALSRYSASVFHSLLVVEVGVIELGNSVGVTDPKRGWDPTWRKLKELVAGGHAKFSPDFSLSFTVIEQLFQSMEAMKNAWRNKVNHAAGQLSVIRPEFAPDVAEEIMFASRSFMRRLAEEMPPVALNRL